MELLSNNGASFLAKPHGPVIRLVEGAIVFGLISGTSAKEWE